jgi:hypothetical protein
VYAVQYSYVVGDIGESSRGAPCGCGPPSALGGLRFDSI